MGYRIEYDSRVGKYEVRKAYPSRLPLLFAGALSLFLLYTALFWTEGAAVLRDFLIPGEDVVTVTAFRNMTVDLRSGAQLSEAVYAFCRFVIHGT